MNARENFKKQLDTMQDSRLAMFVICCHVDKPMEEEMPDSIYHVPIQAGAALTDKRICEINDYDGEEDSISDRNQRYSEMTAMHWIGKNIATDYVGICHYRRRFLLTDQELSDYMEKGFDIITTKPYPLPEIVSENYPASYYGYDWKLFMEILQNRNPEYMDRAEAVFALDKIHPCNMNIFRREVYEEYCEFAFPILDEFYRKSAWKADTYQRRDVGFIGERLSSLFVEQKRAEGMRVLEAPFRDLRSKGWSPEEECDLGDFDEVYKACQKYYACDNITRCRNLVAGALKNGGVKDSRICELANLFHAAIEEQRTLPETMYEYLPSQWKSDLETLRKAYTGLGTVTGLLHQNKSDEVVTMFREFLTSTGFSEIVIRSHCKNYTEKETEEILQYAPFRDPTIVLEGNDICHGALRDLAVSLGKAYEQLGERVIYLSPEDKDQLQEVLAGTKDRISMVIGAQSKALNHPYFKRMKQVPKIQLVVDSPYFIGDFFDEMDEDYYCFFQDFKYAEYVLRYKNCKNVFYLPPGGRTTEKQQTDKIYDVSFVGSYNLPVTDIAAWSDLEREYYEYMLSHTEETYFEGLDHYLREKEIPYEEAALPEMLQKLALVCYAVNYQYRHQIIENLLSADIKLHVFGDTWQAYAGKGKENLMIHPEVSVQESLNIYAQSKLSLNIMSWHKAGITERVLNIMASGSVCVSDKTEALMEEFIWDEKDDRQQIVLFDPGISDTLPEKIRTLLAEDAKRERIAENAAAICRENHSWSSRAKDIYLAVKQK